MTIEEALRFRADIEKAGAGLPDEEAVTREWMFPNWKEAEIYEAGDRVRHEEILYKCLTPHQAQAGWEPSAAPSLWAKVLIPDEEQVYPWEQPDSTNPYMRGDRVSHNGVIWECSIDNNVWEPGIYGWVEEEDG